MLITLKLLLEYAFWILWVHFKTFDNLVSKGISNVVSMFVNVV